MSDTPVRRPRRCVDGLLLLDKPSGSTSNAALQRVKWLYQARKAGHTGSLDPLASGMLPLCFGEATKFAGYLLDADKTYRVQARFGSRTDTADAEGAVVETNPRCSVPLLDLAAAVKTLEGPISQVPPMYSALKQGGQRLYALARAGREVPREARPVHIHAFVVESYDSHAPVLRVRCSKGTYVRTLVEDLAAILGTLAHVIALRRLAVAPYGGHPMLPMAVVEAAAHDGSAALDSLLQPLDSVLPQWPELHLGHEEALRVRLGNSSVVPDAHAPGPVRIYGPGRLFLGVGEVLPEGRVIPRRLRAHESPG